MPPPAHVTPPSDFLDANGALALRCRRGDMLTLSRIGVGLCDGDGAALKTTLWQRIATYVHG